MSLNPGKLGNVRNKNGKNKYKQGHYIPQNIEKYIGHTPISYRSSWEFAFCKFCDMNEKIVKWSTESVIITYQMVNKIGQTETHRYIPDFWVEMISPDDPEKYDRMVIEIKPKSETLPPNPPKKETMKMLENYEYSLVTYKKNLHKWSYAREWCEKRNMKFVIITEDHLKLSGLIPK
jgi:hypothetical protein